MNAQVGFLRFKQQATRATATDNGYVHSNGKSVGGKIKASR